MPRRIMSINVFDAAINRMYDIYSKGHRVVVSFSGGKDSGVCLEICIIAARLAGRLPVDVIMRDEEIMFPGTFEYAERTAKREEVSFRWVIAGQPIINVFNREMPYWWVYDERVDRDLWVRQPHELSERIPDQNITWMVRKERYPVEEGKRVYSVVGLRVAESWRRRMAIASARGHLVRKNEAGVYGVRPIYDWTDGDVWKAIYDNKWDYNEAYDTMARLGLNRNRLRIAPPTLSAASIESLKLAAQAWPRWFDRVCRRLEGVRAAALFGRRAVEPYRRTGETWESCFWRECVEKAPAWIAERAMKFHEIILNRHKRHSTAPLPQTGRCYKCTLISSYESMAKAFYTGDPFCIKQDVLGYVEPEFFRKGAGTWGGKPNF